MVRMRFFYVHRTWQDWLGMGVAVLIGLSPWLADQQMNQAVMLNAVFVGAVALVLAELEIVNLRRWQEIGEILCGLWLAASPFVLGYADAGDLRYWHFALGAGVVLLATLELWQAWKSTDQELARHGK